MILKIYLLIFFNRFSDCYNPFSMVTEECAGKQTCNYYFPPTPIQLCLAEYATSVHYHYNCVPG